MAKVKAFLRRVTVEEFEVEFDIAPVPVNMESKDVGIEARKESITRLKEADRQSIDVSVLVGSVTVTRADDEMFTIEGFGRLQGSPLIVLRHSLHPSESARTLEFERGNVDASW